MKLNQSYLKLNNKMYSIIKANQFKEHHIAYINKQCASDFGIDEAFIRSVSGMDLFVGNSSEYDNQYIAQAYCGHQYGHFNILGDGRAMLLGDFEVDSQVYDIQLKGSGKTLYSRGGDGLATLSSMMREMLVSEAMNGLGVPTTRSLVVMKTGRKVIRTEIEEGAILTRIAKSHIRVGTFQFARMQDKISILKELADFAIERHFKHLSDKEDKYRLLVKEVVNKQARLVAKWQSLGFIHGVMNTDNMAISGETIDYGPCAFMNEYDPSTVYSQIDRNGRYAYGNQPYIAAWNLARFAESLFPLLADNEEQAIVIANEEIAKFKELFEENRLQLMASKIGIIKPLESDRKLIQELLDLMQTYKKDFTNTFRYLSMKGTFETNPLGEVFDEWYKRWRDRLDIQDVDLTKVTKHMQSVNPYVVPRNNWVEQVLKSDSIIAVDEFMEVFKNPYDYSGDLDKHTEYRDNYNYKTHCNT